MHAMYTVGRGQAASSGRLPSTLVRGAAFSIIDLVERTLPSRLTRKSWSQNYHGYVSL